ncbi:unnamed protein product [Mytilus edulis]|uniref:G-protein coupled receptors family 1 profile domain-containing protein n=2 Tax=Mytilus edulis TaxID=6550 RepID=A0A8S3R961_MYTED|nr:unnamed protein product [Mytilus edulis]
MLKSTMMKDYEDFTTNDVWNYTTNSSENHSHLYFSDYTPPDGGEDYEGSYQRKLITYYVSGICGMTICCLGIVGNVMSVIILTRRVMRSSTYSYLNALALSDTLFLLLTMLLARRDTKEPVQGDVNNFPDSFYAHTFPFVHAACLTFQVTSIWLTLAFTVDRYIMICHPFKAERWCSIKRARWVILGLVLAGIAFNFIRFFEYKYEKITYVDMGGILDFNMTANFTKAQQDQMMNSINYKEAYVNSFTELGNNPLFHKVVHIWFYLTCVAGIPFIALFVLNTFLIIAVHNSRKKGKLINAKEKRRNDTTVMLIGVIVIFLICEGPALISRMIYALHFENIKSISYIKFSEISNLLVTLNSAINIVPYYFFGKKFRQQFWRVFCSCVLTKEEIRKITRSLSVSMDRRFSGANGHGGHEMNNIAVYHQQQQLNQQQQQKEENKVYKNSIAVPLILNIEQRTSIDTQNSFFPAHENECLEDLSPTNTELTNEQKKILVNLEANGNCEITVESPCSDCQNNVIL